jgi:TonB family protein
MSREIGELGIAPNSLKKRKKGISFSGCLLISLGLHTLFFALSFELELPRTSSSSPVEIDLTNPFIGSGPAKLGAPKPLAPRTTPSPIKPAPKIPNPQPPLDIPKQWTLPNSQTTKTVPLPPQKLATPGGAKNGTGISPLTGGSGKGANYGTPNGSGNGGSPAGIIPPKLLNLDEVLKNLRRFYPEAERRAGKEGSVLVAIHIGIDGSVSAVDILRPARPDFDAAAEAVAKLMKFSPARNAQGPVLVKIAQEMIFRLDN